MQRVVYVYCSTCHICTRQRSPVPVNKADGEMKYGLLGASCHHSCAQVARHSRAVSVGQSCMCWAWCSPALLYISCTLHGERYKALYYDAKDGELLVQMWCVRISLSRSDTDGAGCAQSIRGHELQSATPDVSGEPLKSRLNICSKVFFCMVAYVGGFSDWLAMSRNSCTTDGSQKRNDVGRAMPEDIH